ncbi:TIGR00303 family protein [halophilic archaeon]|nr:TIGR00303 family protein [halophilic archaeon]
MRFVLVAGCTRTAEIDGISAAGADTDVMVHTPSADLEILEYGKPTSSPVVPVSPTGCPTPAVVSRAVRELLEFETLGVDAGLGSPTCAPTVTVGEESGEDVRRSRPVPGAEDVFENATRLGRALPDDEIVVGETIPGGTTTALGVLTALGERTTVSSSLPENPLALKRDVVNDALTASDLSEGDAAGDPIAAVSRVGDPVLAGVAGTTIGALESGTDVTLAGGTQLAAAAALVRHAGVDDPMSLATTSFVAADETAAIEKSAADLDLALTVTDPEFADGDHPAMDAYVAGEAKEGVGMGGALALADRAGVSMAAVRDRVVDVYERITEAEPAVKP